MTGFKVVYRNYGHWDIWQNDMRIYRIRGGPGSYWIVGENTRQDELRQFFKTLQACMAYVTDMLMYELVVAEGQEPQIIESWNV